MKPTNNVSSFLKINIEWGVYFDGLTETRNFILKPVTGYRPALASR